MTTYQRSTTYLATMLIQQPCIEDVIRVGRRVVGSPWDWNPTSGKGCSSADANMLGRYDNQDVYLLLMVSETLAYRHVG